jgi:hypothetical protein
MVAVALGALLILITGIPALINRTSERLSGFLDGEQTQQLDTREPTSLQEGEYLNVVEDVQVGSVESFLNINEEFSQFDSITAEDVKDMEANRNTLKGHLNRVNDLDPPEEYKDHYELFRLAIADLDQAAELAYSMSADPTSLTQSGLDEYRLLVNRANSRLQQSNDILDRRFETIPSQESG